MVGALGGEVGEAGAVETYAVVVDVVRVFVFVHAAGGEEDNAFLLIYMLHAAHYPLAFGHLNGSQRVALPGGDIRRLLALGFLGLRFLIFGIVCVRAVVEVEVGIAVAFGHPEDASVLEVVAEMVCRVVHIGGETLLDEGGQ